MELLRALGALCEPPRAELAPVAEALGLGALPEAAEHSDLFVFQLYPYASVYLGAEGMLGGEARDRIAGFWRALGLTPPSEPDHLAVLLAFYAGLAEPGEGDLGDTRQRARDAFLWEHLLSWLPLYLEKLRELASPFYRRWSDLLSGALRAEAERRNAPPQMPLALRAAPAMVDPREDGATAFLAALLSPLRCGFVLVRDDLIRAAAELELGRRIGERRFVLEALFGQEPQALLRWLEQHAAGRADAHGAMAAPESIRAFWSGRARATASLLAELRRSDG
jgi:TorA maturation chaperone TorD